MHKHEQSGTLLNLPASPVAFYLPHPTMTLSMYAEMTKQTIRAVQQQANEGRLFVTKSHPGKERRVNMVYELLLAYQEAHEVLSKNQPAQ